MKRRTDSKRIWQGIILLIAILFAGFTQAAGLLTPANSGLPALEIRDHRVDVTIEDGYAITTVEQVFVKDDEKDVDTVQRELSGKIGEKISIRRFARFEVGEGLQKREDDFAAEVAKQAGL